MIIDDCQQLSEKIERYEEIQRQLGNAEILKERQKELEKRRTELEESIQSVEVLAEAELVEQSELPSSRKAKSTLATIRRLFQEDALQLTKGDDYQSFLSEIARVRKRVDEVCQRIWKDFIDDITPAVDHDLLREREEVPEFETIVMKIRALDEELGCAAQDVPRTTRELLKYQEAAGELQEVLDEIYSDEYPPEVIEFLRRANTRKGALLSQLTPAVLQWLEKNDKMEEFCVKTRT